MLTVLSTLSLLLLLSLMGLVRSYGQQQPPMPPLLLRRNIIKVRASGFMPFESDLLLPLGILRQLQSQDRSSRHQRPKAPPNIKPHRGVKQQIRLERAHPLREAKGVQLYNLIDDDGELLLNLKVHQDQKDTSGSYTDFVTKEKSNKYQSKFQDYDSPWLPSKWRPTSSELPLGVTSSSPRPLPLHQYLGQSNHIGQGNAVKRRRLDTMWPHK